MIAQRLKRLRENAEYTQIFVAKYLSISPSAYTYYEKGASAPPLDNLIKLAQLYHVSIDYIAGLTELSEADISDIQLAELIAVYNNLNPTLRTQFVEFSDFLLQKEAKERLQNNVFSSASRDNISPDNEPEKQKKITQYHAASLYSKLKSNIEKSILNKSDKKED